MGYLKIGTSNISKLISTPCGETHTRMRRSSSLSAKNISYELLNKKKITVFFVQEKLSTVIFVPVRVRNLSF